MGISTSQPGSITIPNPFEPTPDDLFDNYHNYHSGFEVSHHHDLHLEVERPVINNMLFADSNNSSFTPYVSSQSLISTQEITSTASSADGMPMDNQMQEEDGKRRIGRRLLWSDSEFPVDERGTMKSVVEYFQETYGFVIHHTQLPCLQVGNQQRPNYLPMEVCKIVEGQRYSKRLNERQITALLKVTCQRPQERERDILQTVRHNAYAEDPYAKEFGIKISERLAQVEARILPAPWLKYHDSGREKDCLPQVGQWNMMNKKMVNGGTVSNWICINFSRNVQDSVVRSFCQELAQMCITSGMNFHPHPVLAPTSARPDQVERALKAKYHDAMTQLPPQRKELDLLIVILPDNNGSLYGDLKRICETDLGIVSQCCLTKHVFKMSKQYLANVALKINVKVGGRNTVLVDALSRRIPLVSDRPTIIFGADVTHPHPGEDSSPSIAAVVASQDWPEVTEYDFRVSVKAHQLRLIPDPPRTVTGGMIKALQFLSVKQLNRSHRGLFSIEMVSVKGNSIKCCSMNLMQSEGHVLRWNQTTIHQLLLLWFRNAIIQDCSPTTIMTVMQLIEVETF